MSRRTSHTDREHAELEIRLLTREESAVKFDREAGLVSRRCFAGVSSSSKPVERDWR